MKKSDSSIILVQGYPGSGKSTIATELSHGYIPEGFLSVSHFSIGGHLRKIAKGKVNSDFRKELRTQSKVLANSQRLSDKLVNDIVDERMASVGESELVLVDGYPLYESQVTVFDKNMRSRGLCILGLLDVQVGPEIAVERILGRGTRESEIAASTEFAWQRITEHQRDSLGTTALLANMYPTVVIDGGLSPEQVLDSAKQGITELV